MFFTVHAQNFRSLHFPNTERDEIINRLINFQSTKFASKGFQIDSIYADLDGVVNIHHFKYDYLGNIIADSVGYRSNIWNNYMRYSWTYISGNLVDTSLIESWNADGFWQSIYLVDYDYSENGVPTEFYTKMRIENQWENKFHYLWTYDSLGILHSTFYEVWENGSWRNVEQDFYTMNENGQIEIINVYEWFDSDWVYEGQFLFSYNEHGLMAQLAFYRLFMGDLYPDTRIMFTYNDNDQKISEIEQRFNNNDSLWENELKKIYEYNENEVISHAESFRWDKINSEWIHDLGTMNFIAPNGFEMYLSAVTLDIYSSYVSSTEEILLSKSFYLHQNYPNPFNPTTTIMYSLPVTRGVATSRQGVTVSLQVFNSLGQKIAVLVNKEQAPGNYTVQFDASKLPSGVYFYTLRAGSFVSTKKMILMK